MKALYSIKNNYNHTIYASYLGYITQAIVNNFAPLLFLRFSSEYELTLELITLITTMNFLIQLAVDLIAPKIIDIIGDRASIVAAHMCAALGLICLALLPDLYPHPYIGIVIAVVLYAVGGGLIEVQISPIVEACPTKKKEAAMSLLHSFYCWGHVFLVIVTTLFFTICGIDNWKILACLWALVPLFNVFYFMIVPIYHVETDKESSSLKNLAKKKVFWLLIVVMICAGASEQAMSQWVSTYAESGLNISKTIGDLAGPCAFAICMGTARALYGAFSEKIRLEKMMSLSATLCIICYVTAASVGLPYIGLLACAVCGFSVGIFWPGTFSIAAKKLPGAGMLMYALMAFAGDIGCSSGPTVVGFVASATKGNFRYGFYAALIFPALILGGICLLKNKKLTKITLRK